MAQNRSIDPGQTYVLEETAITRLNSLEELAEIALRQAEGSRTSNGTGADNKPRAEPRKETPER